MSETGWYYTMGGERLGPVALEVLQTLVRKGRVGEDDLAWREGMESWVPVKDVGELCVGGVEKAVEPVMVAARRESVPNAVQFYEAPNAEVGLEGVRRNYDYGGIGRLAYFFLPFIFLAGLVVLNMVFKWGAFMVPKVGVERGGGEVVPMASTFWFLVACGLIFLMLLPTFWRLKNLGMSRWHALWLLVPVMHWWIQFRLSICPEGYADHKKLDWAGKFLCVLFVLGILAVIGFFVWLFQSGMVQAGGGVK